MERELEILTEFQKSERELEILREFQNSVGHALIDYYYVFGLDRTSNTQARRRAMEKIQIACHKCDLLLTNIKGKE